jgi:type VI secretion system protein ImpL
MTTISALVTQISSYLPQIILGMVITAIILMILMVILTSTSVSNAIKKKKPPTPKPEPADTRPPEDKMPPRGGIFSQLLSLKGYFQVGDLSLIFLKALELLRERLDTVDYKYHLPWYLLIGATNSGKSSIMNRSDLILPLGKPTFDIPDPHPGLRWWFLNRGIVLDVKGDFLIHERGIKADEKGWRTVLSLLTRYRARRPIDGIILTIPATELYGAHKLSEEELTDRAKFLAQKLLATQNLIALRLPVYVVVTKCDKVPGFQSFCQAVPRQNQQNMLGWVSPYHLTVAYTPGWLDEAFGHIHYQLNQVRLEMLAEGVSPDIRDGIFIFPNELMHLHRSIAPYMNQLFKVNSYEESLVLRGIFFCGDSGISAELSQLTSKPVDDSDLDAEYQSIEGAEAQENPVIKLKIGDLEQELASTEEPTSKIYFFGDVLTEKIFAETGLAQPIHQRLISANRNLNLAKAGMAGFVGISTLGLFNAYDRLSENRDYLLPVLGKINSILYEVPQSRMNQTRFGTQVFDEQARQLLDMMNNIQKASFHSIFLPSSWFSPLNTNLRTALKVSYDQIILRAMYMDLLLKARDLLTLRPKATDMTISLASQLQPVTTLEYQLFKGFADQFIELYHNVEKYNRLKDSSDSTLLRELVQYTLGIHLPDEFLENYQYFRRVLKEVPYPKIDLKPYQSAAQETLKILYNYFLNNLFAAQNPNSIIGKINFILKEFGKRETEELPNVEVLRKIGADLNQTIPILGVPGNNWIDGSFFDPGGGFADLMSQISQFPMFGPQIVDQFAADTATAFTKFHEELVRLNTLLVDRSLVPADKPLFPSSGLIALQKSLSYLFAENFMAPPPIEQITFRIPENQVVFWNSKLIDMAIDEIKKYEEFTTKHLSDFPPLIRETLKQTAKGNLQKNILGMIARAQTFAPITQDLPSGLAAEEVLRMKISDVKEVAPKFVKLLEVMEEGQVGTGFVELREMLGALSSRLLTQVEEVLNSYGLYQVKNDNFNWWEGKDSPILEGFNVRDDQDLKTYLATQRQHIQHLAIDFAEPIVTFLTSHIMQDFEGNRPLLTKWKRIIDQVNAYEKQRPDNSITALESTLAKDLVHLDLGKCFKSIPLSEVKGSSGDFFLERRLDLRRDLLSRCEVLKRQRGIENYRGLVDYFNQNLKDKFPFLAEPRPNMAEALPDDIREFFVKYKEAGDNPKEILDQIHQLGEEASGALQFLESMEEIKTFFDTYLKGNPAIEDPTFDFVADFRIKTGSEANENLIIEWFIMPNDATKITNHDKKKNGRWIYGDEVVVGMKWPKASRLQPYRDSTQPRLEVEGEHTAIFRFTSKWALFELIKAQAASRGDFGGQSDPQPHTLKFQIPNGPATKTTAFNRVTLLGPAKGKAPGKPIVLPIFPISAPNLPDAILKKADEPVIVMGAVYLAKQEEQEAPKSEGKDKKDEEKADKKDDKKADEKDDKNDNQEKKNA